MILLAVMSPTPTPVIEQERHTLTSHLAGGELFVGDTITFEYADGVPLDGETVDVFVGTVDQGPSTSSGDYVLNNIPSDATSITLNQLIGGVFTGVSTTIPMVFPASEGTLIAHMGPFGPIVNEGNWSRTAWANAWGVPASDIFYTQGDDRVSTVDINGTRWLSAKHAALDSASSGNIQTALGLTKGRHYIFEQTVMLPDPFSFGGPSLGTQAIKMGAGIAQGRDNNGLILGGGNIASDASSVRMYSRGDGSKPYTYPEDRESVQLGENPAFGDEYPRGVNRFMNNGPKLIPGQEHNMKIEVYLNDVGQSNGWMKQWHDGVLHVDEQNMSWTTSNDPRWDTAWFASYHGGNDSFNPAFDVRILYRDQKYYRVA